MLLQEIAQMTNINYANWFVCAVTHICIKLAEGEHSR